MAENELLRGLLSEGFAHEPSIFGPEDRLDTLLDPAEIVQVIDADASETKVIEEVRRGSSLVVQGPPGTGKSQTITNLIAAAAHDGKTVLFVAEKMAALSLVHDRLVKTGLRDICLELHSRNANKKALAQELGRTLMASTRTLPAVSDTAGLRRTRDDLMLENLGWQFHRIWSTDWFHRRDSKIRRLAAALESARQASRQPEDARSTRVHRSQNRNRLSVR